VSKADRAQIIAREKEIMDLMARGERSTDIVRIMSEKHGISTRNVERLYSRVISSMQQLVEQSRSEIRAKLVARADFIYKKAIELNNLKVGISAIEQIAKLSGINDNIEGTDNKPKVLVINERTVEQLPEPGTEQSDET
jgi:hypothetical protein